MLETWARLGEIIELRWKDVDLDRGQVSIRRAQSMTTIHNPKTGKPMTTWVAGPPKTRESLRTIPLSPTLLAELRRHRKHQVTENQQWTAEALVFPNQSGGWLDRARLGKELAEACARARIPKVTAHGLRHTGGSLIAHVGFDPKTISERMGSHPNPSPILG
jgi:integrase